MKLFSVSKTKQPAAVLLLTALAVLSIPAAHAELPAKPSQKIVADSQGRKTDKHGMASYADGEHTRHVRTTAYSCMENEPGAHGNLNAAGTVLKYGKTIRSAAADWSVYPLGTKFKIKGLPYTYVVEDYGSALTGTNTIDIYKPTLRKMNHWGTRKVEITVVKWGCYDKSRRILKHRTGYWHCRKMYNEIKRKLSSEALAKL
ncbi:3D domain-containing protein [Rubritalea marina]|uniref:3D domain-containing protein n=1 Tax=Rubritalea marina TaxID=361055 RepID=UPI00037F04CA|nr:3D domain-containing protein [Rubritalea marina]